MIYEFGTEQVNQKLCEKEESGYQSNVTERNMVVTVKFQKKKRCEVCSNSLCDKARNDEKLMDENAQKQSQLFH